MTAPTWGLAGNLGSDLALLRRLRVAGFLRGVRPLAALVAIRRARRGEGDPAIVRAVKLAGECMAPRTHGARGGAA